MSPSSEPPRRVGAEPQVLLDRQLGEGAAALGDVRDAELRDRLRAAAAERLPAKMISPLRLTVPEIARSVVVLPAPFAPSTATIWPSSTASETPSSARTGP